MDRIWNPKVVHMKGCKPFLDYGEQWNAFTVFLGRFAPDEEVESIVRKKSTIRSHRQNRYYWGVVLKILSDYTGYEVGTEQGTRQVEPGHSPEHMHDAMTRTFLSYTEGPLTFVRSTTELNTKEFEQYVEDVRHWASVVWGLNIPLPNEAE